MDGKQQEPQTAKNSQEKACVCSESHVHESNGCSECRCQNRSNVVQVPVLFEISPNKPKRNKALRIIGAIPATLFFIAWESLALFGAWQIEDENVYLSAFYTIVNWSFVAVAGWYFCGFILDKFDIMD